MTETLQTRQDNLERYETELVIREAFPNSTVRTLHSAVKMCDPNALKEFFFIAKKGRKTNCTTFNQEYFSSNLQILDN